METIHPTFFVTILHLFSFVIWCVRFKSSSNNNRKFFKRWRKRVCESKKRDTTDPLATIRIFFAKRSPSGAYAIVIAKSQCFYVFMCYILFSYDLSTFYTLSFTLCLSLHICVCIFLSFCLSIFGIHTMYIDVGCSRCENMKINRYSSFKCIRLCEYIVILYIIGIY